MTTFVLAAVLLVAIALAWLLPPFLRRTGRAQVHDRIQMNLGLLRDQRADLDADLARGTLSAEQYAESKSELERRVLEETETQARAAVVAPRGARLTAGLLGAAVPVAAALLYLWLGDPGALDLQQRTVAAAGHSKMPTAEEIETMLTRLAKRLEKEPNNPDGWAMLARSYYIMRRYPDAVVAYEKLVKLVPNEADVLADYADALAMRDGRKISGRPLELVMEALKLDPTQAKALAMAGTEAFDRKDYRHAVEYWEKLRDSAPPDSEIAQNVSSSIAEARSLGGLGAGTPAPTAQRAPTAPAPSTAPATPAPAGAATVQGTVRLDPALAARAAPTDTVFVFARASEGPRVPLAVLKLQAKDLPAKFVLDDSLAMAPQFRLSNFKSVVVNARLSKSGLANPSAGDFEGQGVAVSLGARDAALIIDRVVK
jgi:cytochrome c-type biogenesis protein CcmH